MPRLSKIGAAALAAFGWSTGANVVVDYLVVAGGGSGGNGRWRWRRCGWLSSGTESLNPTLSYTITVGAGAPVNTTSDNVGTGSKGSDSAFFGITSTGGGYGAVEGPTAPNYYGVGGDGGSGGGGSRGGAGGSGNTPSTSPSQGNNAGTSADKGAAGGGGSGAVGGNGGATTGGNGGAGTASSITGSSVTYAGGGGGGVYTTGTAGTGGSGGGGNGGAPNGNNGIAGTANTGGGGGGASGGGCGGAGGSGVVIISYTSATQKFGGGIVTQAGGKFIHTFTSSGALSPLSSVTADYLVVAGGGGGGGQGNASGAGGAGGLLSGSGLALDANSIYTVTVGSWRRWFKAQPQEELMLFKFRIHYQLHQLAAVGGGYGKVVEVATGALGGSGGGGAGFKSR
jgi:hypothetical protein